MKTCTKCNKTKPFADFCKGKRFKDGHQPWCKSCAAISNKNRYSKISDQHKQQVAENRKRIIEWYESIKNDLSCVVCGESTNCCLDFHHVDSSTKRDNVSNMACHGLSKETILKEISLCIVVCKNCHCKIHDGLIDDASYTNG